MKEDLPEKLKPIVESWTPGENTILYIEREDDGLTTLVLGSKNSIIVTLCDLVSKICENSDMDILEIISELIGFAIWKKAMGDEDETEENH